MPPKVQDYYVVLGLRNTASEEDVKKAFRKKALLCHPDKRPPPEREAALEEFKKVVEAYEVLADPKTKSEYDAEFSKELGRNANSTEVGVAAVVVKRVRSAWRGTQEYSYEHAEEVYNAFFGNRGAYNKVIKGVQDPKRAGFSFGYATAAEVAGTSTMSRMSR